MRSNTIMSEFFCTQCGCKGIPVWRKKGKEREAGHLKRLFCLKCNKETNHIEIKPDNSYTYLDFKIEYEYGNFTEEGNRVRSYGELRSLIKDEKINKQKTLDDGGNTRIG